MAATKRTASCGELSKKFNFIPLAHEFMLSLPLLVVDNIEKFQTNSDIHSKSTRYNLHVPNSNFSEYKKGVYYNGIKLFTILPPNMKSLNHYITMFKPALKECLLSHFFYSVEVFTSNKNSQL
jgi:hypothetical protein